MMIRNHNRIWSYITTSSVPYSEDKKIESKDFVDLSIPIPKVDHFGNNHYSIIYNNIEF